MRIIILSFLLSIGAQLQAQNVPFLMHDDFEFKMDYDFKAKPPPEQGKVNYMERDRQTSTGLLPYVKVNFTFHHVPDQAFRVRVYDGKGDVVTSRKLKKIDELSFDLGYSDDIKDRVEPHTYYIYLENKEKERLSQIKIFVEESGDFYLNDELFGRI